MAVLIRGIRWVCIHCLVVFAVLLSLSPVSMCNVGTNSTNHVEKCQPSLAQVNAVKEIAVCPVVLTVMGLEVTV